MKPEEKSTKPAAFQVGDWLVQPELHRLLRGQVAVRVRARVMDVLCCFLDRVDRVVSKGDLVDAVWPGGNVADNTVTHAIQELRAALGDDASDPRYLETVHRRGYRLVAPTVRLTGVTQDHPIFRAQCTLSSNDCQIFLIEGENLIGRGRDTQIFLDSPKISRHHARITVTIDAAEIEDLGSKNGTFVEGVSVGDPARLEDGDWVSFSHLRFVFRTVDVGGRGTLSRTNSEAE